MSRRPIADALIAELKRAGIDRCLLCDDHGSILLCPRCRRPDCWEALKAKLDPSGNPAAAEWLAALLKAVPAMACQPDRSAETIAPRAD